MMPFWIGFVLAAGLAYPLFQMLLKMNSRQKVSEFAPATHQAKQGTPTMGGLLFVIPFVVGATWIVLSRPVPNSPFGFYSGPEPSPDWLFPNWGFPLILLFLLFAAIGFVDDYVVPRMWPGKRGLGWKQKLGMQFVVALLYSLTLPSGPAGTHFAQVAFTIFAILFCSNAYNFADGLDGLASSIVLILIPGLILANGTFGHPDFGICLKLLAGTMLPFAFLNAPKAKVFMGDVGSLAVGALVGASFAVPVDQLSFKPSGYWIGLAILSMVLVAELVPVPLQILWVKLFKRRLFPFTPIHHAFEKAGWPETRVVALFAGVQLLCTMGCITLLEQPYAHVVLR